MVRAYGREVASVDGRDVGDAWTFGCGDDRGDPLDARLTRIAVEPTATSGIEHVRRIMVDKITTMPRDNLREHIGRLPDADVVRLAVRAAAMRSTCCAV